jgi:endonuclease-3
MKNGAEYAKRIKRLYHQLLRRYGKPDPPDHADPLDQLIVSILSRGTTDAKAHAAYNRLRASVVDYNEMRVTPSVEVADAIGRAYPDADARSRDIVNVLNALYDKRNAIDLAFLRSKPLREAREYLLSLPGVDDFAAARVVLFCLGGHAVPVDGALMNLLRKEECVSPDATLAEVQSFLERHVHATEAAAFATLMHRHAATVPVPPPPPSSPPGGAAGVKPAAKTRKRPVEGGKKERPPAGNGFAAKTTARRAPPQVNQSRAAKKGARRS